VVRREEIARSTQLTPGCGRESNKIEIYCPDKVQTSAGDTKTTKNIKQTADNCQWNDLDLQMQRQLPLLLGVCKGGVAGRDQQQQQGKQQQVATFWPAVACAANLRQIYVEKDQANGAYE